MPTLIHLLWVAAGGAIGSVLRYLLALSLNGTPLSAYPLGTLTANLIGCFALGLILGSQRQLSDTQLAFFATGVCGGLTTFSSLEAEALVLGRSHLWQAALYLGASLALGLLAVWAGLRLTR